MARVPDLEAALTPEMRREAEEMMRRRGLPTLGFYGELMAYPDLFERLQALGSFVRFDPALPSAVREAEVLMTAVELRSAFEWQTHAKSSAAAGVGPDLSAAIARGAPLRPFGESLEDIRSTVRCVVRQQSLPQAVFERLIGAFGLPGALEAVAVPAMYRMFASLAAAFDSEMPGAEPPPW